MHLSSTDTDMMAGWDVPKNDPVTAVALTPDGVEAGRQEILADAETAAVKAQLAADPEELYAPFTAAAH